MTDEQTLKAYNSAASEYAKEWNEQPVPNDLYELLLQYFEPGPTADIGCGSGRDIAWLASKGFEVHGFDASEGLLQEARKLYPNLLFNQAELPELKGIAPLTYQNVICETVIMHLDPGLISSSIKRLMDILRNGGNLYLSWRVTDGDSLRDKSGRLYAAFDKTLVLNEISGFDKILFDREDISASSGRKIHRLIVRKGKRDNL